MENYLAELEQLLHQLHHSDKEEAMNFYREYVMDADLVTYEQCISELGTPKQLSRKILADYSIKADEKLSLIHISEPTRRLMASRMPSSA